jgi:uncharacterized protein YuzE
LPKPATPHRRRAGQPRTETDANRRSLSCPPGDGSASTSSENAVNGGVQLSYDPRYNVAYIRLREKTAEVETIRVSDELNVDLAPDGTVYGIELLNANEQLGASDDGRLIVVEAEGKERSLALASEARRSPAGAP